MKRNQTPIPALALLTLALIAPAQAETTEPPAATQPATSSAKTAESPATLPATQPSEKPKPKLNDAPPRKNVPIVIKEAKDIWKLLPEDLRPGKDGKVSDELAEKIKAWAKENKGKFEQKLQFVSTKSSRIEHAIGLDAFFQSKDKTPRVDIKAPLRDADEYSKIQGTKYNPGKEKLVPEYQGVVSDLKVTGNGENIEFSIVLKDIKVLKVSVALQEIR